MTRVLNHGHLRSIDGRAPMDEPRSYWVDLRCLYSSSGELLRISLLINKTTAYIQLMVIPMYVRLYCYSIAPWRRAWRASSTWGIFQQSCKLDEVGFWQYHILL